MILENWKNDEVGSNKTQSKSEQRNVKFEITKAIFTNLDFCSAGVMIRPTAPKRGKLQVTNKIFSKK